MVTITFVIIAFAMAGAVTANQCTDEGGQCVDWRYYVCNAGVETGICPGDSNTRCCLNCDNQCQAEESSYEGSDGGCTNQGGSCRDNSNYCSGIYESGLCGGPSTRQCCVTNSAGCTLEVYSTTYIKGYNGLSVRVEPGFVASMDNLNTFAQECGVTVYVTQAYRVEGQPVNGAIVPPASNSNHLVGHAIDMNLETPDGWCNGDCIYYGNNANSECFINKAINSGLRWGGVWSPSDPVHIDDGLNLYDPDEWNSLYYQLQGSCD